MSLRLRQLAGGPAGIISIVVVAALVFATIPTSNATHLTGSTDVVVDATIVAPASYNGTYLGDVSPPSSPAGFQLRVSTAYELTVTNITPTSGQTAVEIVSPNGTVVVAGTSYTSGYNSSVRNATFLVPSSAIGTSTIYNVRELGGTVKASLYFGPRAMTVSASPNPVTYSSSGFVITYSALANSTLEGPCIPTPATTDANGQFTAVQACPGVGTHLVWARKQTSNVTTNGVNVPEHEGSTFYTVVEASSANLVQSDLQVPSSATVGQPVVVRVNVTNTGNATGTGTVQLLVNDVQRASHNVTLAPSATTQVNFSFTPTVAGTYSVETRLGNSTLGPQSVTATAAATTARVSIGNFSGGILAPITAPIMLRNISDFGSATVTLTVDTNVVTVTGVSSGTIPGGNLSYSFNHTTGQLTVLITTTARPGVSGDFVIANVSLQATGSAGSTSLLDLGVTELVTSDGASIAHTVTDGSFRAGLLGDADGDGDIDAMDAIAIADAVVGNRSMTSIVVADADVTRDGVVTGKDAMFLRQYLAGTRATL